MGKKERLKKQARQCNPWCWYCEREFNDEKTLITHQRSKHFRCTTCGKRLNTISGLVTHCVHVHKESLTRVPNANEGHDSTDIDIFGMEGVPEEDIQAHKMELQEKVAKRMKNDDEASSFLAKVAQQQAQDAKSVAEALADEKKDEPAPSSFPPNFMPPPFAGAPMMPPPWGMPGFPGAPPAGVAPAGAPPMPFPGMPLPSMPAPGMPGLPGFPQQPPQQAPVAASPAQQPQPSATTIAPAPSTAPVVSSAAAPSTPAGMPIPQPTQQQPTGPRIVFNNQTESVEEVRGRDPRYRYDAARIQASIASLDQSIEARLRALKRG